MRNAQKTGDKAVAAVCSTTAAAGVDQDQLHPLWRPVVTLLVLMSGVGNDEFVTGRGEVAAATSIVIPARARP